MRQRKSSSRSPLPGALLRRLARTARSAAESVGAFVDRRHRATGIAMRRKGPGDFVTAVDVAAERSLRRAILADWPDHGVLGEELPPHGLDAEFVWVVDPIDGTSNFGRGLPVFAVSVACMHRGWPIAAAVHCLPERVTYHAATGLGSRRGSRPVVLGPGGGMDDTTVVGVQWHRVPRSLDYLTAVVGTGCRVRNFGCTVTQLADVAAGRLDANVQEQGKLWDFAAAALVVLEAGGRFTSWSGAEIFPVALHEPGFDPARHYPSVAARPAVHRQLVRILAVPDGRRPPAAEAHPGP